MRSIEEESRFRGTETAWSETACVSTQSASPARRTSRRIFIPTLFVLVVALVWSGFWFFARAKADQAIAEALAREAAKGRVVTCSHRTSGGFPFRIEVRCADPKLVMSRAEGSLTATAANLVAVAQVYRPNHVIVEAEGPLGLTLPDGKAVEARWASAQASIIVGLDGPQRVSLAVAGLDVSEAAGGTAEEIASGVGLEAHARVSQGAAAAPGSYDVVVTADAAAVPLVDAALGGKAPARAEFQGVVTGLTDLGPKSLEERLREWAEAGGALDVALARLDRGPTSAKVTGKVALDGGGRPEGKLVVTIAGIDDLSAGLRRSGAASPKIANVVGVGLAMLGKPSNIDGRAAVEIPLTLAGGKASIGAFPAGPTPKFF
jgi:hypothetical protein